jgi:hypothetical protein
MSFFNDALGHAMVQAVTRLPHTAETRFLTLFSPCEICGDKVAVGQGFFRVFRVFPVSIIPPWLSVVIYSLMDE